MGTRSRVVGDGDLSLVVAGCRGSMSVSGPEYARFGGNTTCFYAEVEPNHFLVIDAGTGLRRLQHLVAGRTAPQRFTIFLSHYHWDHLQGLPMFSPLYDATAFIDLWAPPLEGRDPEDLLFQVICRPWWPVALRDVPSDLKVRSLTGSVDVGPVRVSHAELHHPGGVVGYRLDARSSIVIATDQEIGVPEFDRRLVDLARGASVLVNDGQYTPEETSGPRAGWGHSDWDGAACIAVEAGVERLVLTSHDPERTDEQVLAILEATRRRFPATEAAHEGMTIPF